jgi:hypothetical protein
MDSSASGSPGMITIGAMGMEWPSSARVIPIA